MTDAADLRKTLRVRASRALTEAIAHKLGVRRLDAETRGIARAADLLGAEERIPDEYVRKAYNRLVRAFDGRQHPLPDAATLHAAAIILAALRMEIDDILTITGAHCPVLVTQHESAAEWLARETGIRPLVVPSVDNPSVLRGRVVVVVGAMPLDIAADHSPIWAIDLPRLPTDWRGRNLSPDEMDQAGARLVCYHVRRA